MSAKIRAAWLLAGASSVLCCLAQAQGQPPAPDRDATEWRSTGRDVQGTYYSPLSLINDHNVATLGHAWTARTGTSRGLEATPLVVDGVMYTSGTWGMVYALDAATGKSLWTFTPKMDRQVGRDAEAQALTARLRAMGYRVAM